MPKAALFVKPSGRVGARVAPTPVAVQNPRLDRLLDERLVVAAKFDQLKARKEELDKEILAATVKEAGEKGTIETDEYSVTDTHGRSSNISAELLLQLGVRPKVIEKATKHTPWSYPRITRKKTAQIEDVIAARPKGEVRRARKSHE